MAPLANNFPATKDEIKILHRIRVLLSAGTLTLLQYINIVNLNYVRPYTSSFRHVIILRRLEWPTPNHQRQSLEAGNESNKGSSWPLFIVGLITRWDSRGRDRAELSQSPAFIMWWPEHPSTIHYIYIVLQHLRLLLLLLASYNTLLLLASFYIKKCGTQMSGTNS
jgi:hypothetical protein